MKRTRLIFALLFLFALTGCSGRARGGCDASPSNDPSSDSLAAASASSSELPERFDSPYSTGITESLAAASSSLSPERLTEADAETLLAELHPGAELLALAPTYYADFLFYRTEARVCVDALNAVTHELLAADLLRDYADYQICAYGSGTQTADFLPVYLSERDGDICSFPSAVVLKWVNGEIESVFDAAAPVGLPLFADGFSVGESWTKPILDGWRLGYDGIAFAFSAADGAERIEGRETLPLTRIDYDAEAHALVLTMANTRLSAMPEAIGGGNHFIRAVSCAEEDGCVQMTIQLTENAGCYSQNLRVYGGTDQTPEFHGIMEILFTAGTGSVVPLS